MRTRRWRLGYHSRWDFAGFAWPGSGPVAFVAFVKAELRALPQLCRPGRDRAVARGRSWCAGGCLPAGESAVDDLEGAAAQRGHARRQPGLSGDNRSVARGASGVSPEGGETRDQPSAAFLCAGSACGCHSCRWRYCDGWPNGALERSTARATPEPTVGIGMEPTANRAAVAARLPG